MTAKKRMSGIYTYPKKPGLSFAKENPKSISKTQQHFKADADIHTIMDRYTHTGLYYDPLKPPTRQPQYGDYSNVDYQGLQNTIAKINNDFSLLPSNIRRMFGDNPQIMIDWLSNPENKEEAIKLGLLPRKEEAKAASTVDIPQEKVEAPAKAETPVVEQKAKSDQLPT